MGDVFNIFREKSVKLPKFNPEKYPTLYVSEALENYINKELVPAVEEYLASLRRFARLKDDSNE